MTDHEREPQDPQQIDESTYAGIGYERAVEHGAVEDDRAGREADAPGVAEVYRSGS